MSDSPIWYLSWGQTALPIYEALKLRYFCYLAREQIHSYYPMSHQTLIFQFQWADSTFLSQRAYISFLSNQRAYIIFLSNQRADLMFLSNQNGDSIFLFQKADSSFLSQSADSIFVSNQRADLLLLANQNRGSIFLSQTLSSYLIREHTHSSIRQKASSVFLSKRADLTFLSYQRADSIFLSNQSADWLFLSKQILYLHCLFD